MKPVTIVGGGIAGLTAAIALRRAGHAITLMERAPRFEAVGAGIVLAPNATRILAALGVDLSAGHAVTRFFIRDSVGRVIQTVDMTRIMAETGPALTFDRPALHRALVRAIPSDVDLRLGTTWSQTEGLTIGADGIRSAVREAAIGLRALRYSGATCWRGICRNPGIKDPIEDWGGAARIGLVPLAGDRLYVFLVLTAPAGMPREDRLGPIRQHFEHFSEPVPAVLDALEDVPLLHHDLEELEQPVWGRGSIILIGDAAHAMTPNQGQGASMAIEDAAVLPRVIDTADPPAEIAKIRHARVAKVQRDSRRLGEVAHWQGFAARVRDTLMPLVPESFGENHYRNLVSPGLKIAAELR
jgi:2-polyprenyl-6-methoxyphenol hydroxylase-like FAD-dependent oxidoreductase